MLFDDRRGAPIIAELSINYQTPMLPKSFNTVSIEQHFVGYQEHTLYDCLGNQNSVERVAMQSRQSSRNPPVPRADRQPNEPPVFDE